VLQLRRVKVILRGVVRVLRDIPSNWVAPKCYMTMLILVVFISGCYKNVLLLFMDHSQIGLTLDRPCKPLNAYILAVESYTH
jgi:hypothetical protein